VVVLIDYPGFNWNIARLAKKHGIPVVYFVPPQLWAWAGWRVQKMRKWVDRVLCSLPFEEAWYRQRGVEAEYIGHPYFDELTHHQPDADFLRQQQGQSGPIVALLPGSRDQEIDRNLSTLLRSARFIRVRHPEVRFLVACLRSDQKDRVETWIASQGGLSGLEVHSGRTGEIIQLAHCAVTVSGSVSLEMLYHKTPAVVVYRMGRFGHWLVRRLVTCRFMTLVNLLADEELFPEFPTHRCEAEAVSARVVEWLDDPAAYQEVCEKLADLRQRVVAPGATERAAQAILEIGSPRSLAA
jgi:lipid-A-disaccharide synthase